MRGIVYRGPRDVALEQVADPTIETPLDAVVRITSTNICGSDLHMYEGRTTVETGTVFGHENMGIVEAVGAGVDRIRVGDRVVRAVQHRVRNLLELHTRMDRVLSAHESEP